MRRQLRGPTPAFLENQWEQWGLEWESRRASDTAARWNGRSVNGSKVHEELISPLREQAQHHCSFCDAFPVSPPSNETIEHFRPKSKFPRWAWHWPNLFYCCDFCQSRKKERWDEALLSPDAPEYDFHAYFWADSTNGKIEILPHLDETASHRARTTLDLYGLNHPRHCVQRLLAQERRSALPDWPIDGFPYRDYLECGQRSSA